MDNDTIVNYVMNTPDNTNPRVLRDMLSQLNNGGGGGEATVDVHIIYDEDTEDYYTQETVEEIADLWKTKWRLSCEVDGRIGTAWLDGEDGYVLIFNTMYTGVNNDTNMPAIRSITYQSDPESNPPAPGDVFHFGEDSVIGDDWYFPYEQMQLTGTLDNLEITDDQNNTMTYAQITQKALRGAQLVSMNAIWESGTFVTLSPAGRYDQIFGSTYLTFTGIFYSEEDSKWKMATVKVTPNNDTYDITSDTIDLSESSEPPIN